MTDTLNLPPCCPLDQQRETAQPARTVCCPACGKKFRTEYSLAGHLRDRHGYNTSRAA